MNQKQLKGLTSILLLIAAMGVGVLFTLFYKWGEMDAAKSCPLTPDSREFLHGKILDLPEEIVDNDSTKVLLHRVTKDSIFIYYK